MIGTGSLVLGIVLVLGFGLWATWRIFDHATMARSRKLEEESGYYTMCEYGENEIRFQVRRPISERKVVADYEIPDFLRKPSPTPQGSARDGAAERD